MLFPDYRKFAELAQNATLVPVAKKVAADLRTPVSAFLNIAAEEPDSFLLESVEGGEKVGRYTFLGARPYMVLHAQGDRVTLDRG
ncbi:MAG: anthranilate synthase component I, partial [Candidatus Angelobacter sp.]